MSIASPASSRRLGAARQTPHAPVAAAQRVADEFPGFAALGAGLCSVRSPVHSRVLRISIFANETDLSYGIYLYAWPIQITIAYLSRSITALTLSFLALVISAVFAYFSWTLIEKPALGLAHRGRAARVSAAPPPARDPRARRLSEVAPP